MNTIHATPIPNRQAATIRNAWQSTYKTLLSRGYSIQHHILDNECSAELKTAFAKYNIDYQLVPLQSTESMPLSAPSAPSKTTSLQHFAQSIHNSLYPSGTD